MSESGSSIGSKVVKTLGVIAVVGIIIAVARLVLKGMRSASSEPKDEHNGI